MENCLEAELQKTQTHYFESFTKNNLCNHLHETQPAILLTFAGVTYACVKSSESYRVFVPYFSKKIECRATIRDFSSIEDLFSHLFGEGVDIEYPLGEALERLQIMETLGSLENKPFTFESVKEELEKNWILSLRFKFSSCVNQEYFDEFAKTRPLEHPANRLKLLAKIYLVNYSPVILTPLKIRAVDSSLLFENAGEE